MPRGALPEDFRRMKNENILLFRVGPVYRCVREGEVRMEQAATRREIGPGVFSFGDVSALEHVRKMGEGREGRRSILLPARRRLTRCVSHLIPLVLIVVTVETQQLPVAAVEGIVVMIMVLVMDRELIQLLAVKVASAVRTDPRK